MKHYILIFFATFFLSKINAQTELNTHQLNGYFEDLTIATKYPEMVKHLNLMYNDLTSIPEVVFKFKNLEVLDISNNKIEILSERLSELPKLSKLFVNANKIQSLPPNFASLKITTLYIQINPVNELPNFHTFIPSSVVKLEAGNPPVGSKMPKGTRQ